MALKVMTWNVENLGNTSPAQKIDLLAATISTVQPDVVALQEILTNDAGGTPIRTLADRLHYQVAVGTPDGRNNRVGFLLRNAAAGPPQVIDQWRLPAGTTVQDNGPGGAVVAVPQMPRAALRVTINHANNPVDIINCHLKSKLLTFPGGFFTTQNETLRAQTAYFALQRRAAEAKTLREHVNDLLNQNRRVILVGDFNDGPLAATTEILYGPDGSQPQGPEDATRLRAFQRADQEDARRLFNVTMFIPPEERWSRKHNGQPELLDHVLASADLMPRAGTLRQVPTLEILNDDLPTLGDQPRDDAVVPDHAPVIATFAV